MWRAVATRENAPAYRRHLEQSVVPQLQALPGFLGMTLMQAERGDRVEMVVSSRWESMDAVRAFAGPEYETAVVPEGARRLLARFDARSAHYEVVQTAD